ncbi:MAG: alpha-hydroxy-acid oxidizing protein [Solirubrobacteraceae bacterium]
MTTIHLDYQRSIYEAGLRDERPALPFAHDDLERRARELIGPRLYSWVGGGAGAGETIRANRSGFAKWAIVQRMLRDVSQRDMATEVCGMSLVGPVGLAPIGVHTVLHPDGELAVARAAAATGVPLVASTPSGYTLEQIAAASGDAPRWFQLYWPNDRELAISFLDRAQRAGYGAIVVTLDTFLLGWRPTDLAGGYMPFLRGVGLANYLSDPVFRSQLTVPPEEHLPAAVRHWTQRYSDPSLTWADLDFLREHTSLPILLKGIVHPDDAREAAARGMDGVVVSNHGGRQVDGAIGAIDALPSVVAAVPEGFAVLFDSGIRTGADIVKAIALGARAVLVGRPYMWGLALGGEPGVCQVVQGLLAELELTLALSGCASPADASPELLREVGR